MLVFEIARNYHGWLTKDAWDWINDLLTVVNAKPIRNEETAHAHSFCNRTELERSEVCGCFYCLSIFPPSEIVEWIDETAPPLFRDNKLVRIDPKPEQTAICPKCPVDSVIGSASGYPITTEFIELMYKRWFGS